MILKEAATYTACSHDGDNGRVHGIHMALNSFGVVNAIIRCTVMHTCAPVTASG